MALWQFDVYLVPRRVAALPEREDSGDGGWDGVDSEVLLGDFRALGLDNFGWANDTWQIGKPDGNTVLIGKINDRIDEISVRIDLQDADSSFLYGIVTIAKKWNLMIKVGENVDPIEPDAGLLKSEIRKSLGYKFVSDPINFFKDDTVIGEIEKLNNAILKEIKEK